jgi:aspartate kinase
MIDIHKFGGTALQNPETIQSIPSLLGEKFDNPLILVVSAMGDVTRQLEKIFQKYLHQQDYTLAVDQVYQFHQSIIKALFGDKSATVLLGLDTWRQDLHQELTKDCPPSEVEQRYSQLIAWGEILSSKIVHHYFLHIGIPFIWLDAREYIKTNQGFKDASLDEDHTYALIHHTLLPLLKKDTKILIQGFIASNRAGYTTTLGKEGSDFTAAILAAGLGATSLTIWKDVPGIMNSDPQWTDQPTQFFELNYETMATMSFYGAQVIHPKTIAPLAQRNISLHIRSFKNKSSKGTHISNQAPPRLHQPMYILKQEQVFVTISKSKFAFFEENALMTIFESLHRLQLQANFIDRDPYSLSLCLNDDGIKIFQWMRLIESLFQFQPYPNATLLTILGREPMVNNPQHPLLIDKKIIAKKYSQEVLQIVFST